MNRRGFLRGLAGALVAGRFTRLAPAPAPPTPAALQAAAYDFEHRWFLYMSYVAAMPGHRVIISGL